MESENSEREVVKHNIEYIKTLILDEKPRHFIIDEIEKVIQVVNYNKSAQLYMLWKISTYLQSRGKSLTESAIYLNKAKKSLFVDEDKTEEMMILNQVNEFSLIDRWILDLYKKLKLEEMEANDPNKEGEIKEVFVTYSWDSEEHKLKVLSFFNHLRKKGFNTDIDRKVSQEESSADFYKMMHSAMTDYKKVIVVLSKGYKEKADSFKGGVGTEYGLIIKDIEDNPNKYVLVAFDGINNDITPLNFKGREIIDLSNPENEDRLFLKLQDLPEFDIEPVAAEKPHIAAKPIPEFKMGEAAAEEDVGEVKGIKILNLNRTFVGASSSARLYKNIEFKLKVVILNQNEKSIAEYSVEVIVPKNLTNHDAKGKIDEVNKTFKHNSDSKLFSGQEIEVEIGNLKVTNEFAEEAFQNDVIVKVYSDLGVAEKRFPISEMLIVSDFGGYRTLKLKLDDFHDKNYRR